MAVMTSPVKGPAHVDLTEREFESRLASAGHSPSEIHALWEELVAPERERALAGPRVLSLGAILAVYIGGFLLVVAGVTLLAENWDALGGGGLLVASLLYGTGFLVAGEVFRRRRYAQPAGVLQTAAVCFVPVAVVAVYELAGAWPEEPLDGYIRTPVSVLAGVTLVATVALLATRPFPLQVLPLAAAVALLAMDAAEALSGTDERVYQSTAIVLGVAGICGVVALDVRKLRWYASVLSWPSLCGVAVGLGGLMPENVAGYGLIGLLGAAAVFFSLVVGHWSFAVFGAAGILAAVSGAISKYGEIGAPLTITVVGLLFIGGGLYWNARRDELYAAFVGRLSPRARALVERLGP